MATATINPTREADGDQCVEFHDIGWKGYCTLLRLRGERSMPRMVYLDGTVWLMSPAFPHERLKKRLGSVRRRRSSRSFDIPCIPAGSTTFRRRAKKGGVEGDQTYYLANEERVRGKKKLHLKTDPPPDLAIEAVHSHDADAAIEVYRRFKVPEVWVCDEAELVILVLQPNGRYAAVGDQRWPSRSSRRPRYTTGCGGPRRVRDRVDQAAPPAGSSETLKPRVRQARPEIRTKNRNPTTSAPRS